MSDEMNQSKSQINWVLLLPLLFFISLVILLATGLNKDPTILESQLIGRSIPTFSVPLLLSPKTLITNNDIQGPALINVFASWCPSCYHEHPYLMKLADKKVIKIFGLNYNDERNAGLKFIKDLGNPYDAILFDGSGRLGIEFGVYGAPETFVINSDNLIVYRHVGIVDDKVWLNKIKPLILLTALPITLPSTPKTEAN